MQELIKGKEAAILQRHVSAVDADLLGLADGEAACFLQDGSVSPAL